MKKGAEAADILARSHARLLFCIGNFLGTDYPALLAPVRPACLEKIVVLGAGQGGQPWADFVVRPAGRTYLEVQVLYSPGKGKS